MIKSKSIALLFVAWTTTAAWTACASAACPCKGICRTFSSGGWLVHESPNFRICSLPGEARAGTAAAEAEALRRELSERWLGDAGKTWNPRCQIVLHRTLAGYLKAVPGGSQSVGSSLVEIDGQRVVTRRIDVRADRADWLRNALAHELTHVVLADLFIDRPVPRWADEGMAVLADTPAKRGEHLAEFRQAHARQDALRLVQLVGMEQYPAAGQGVFYGQSVSLVQFLLEQGTPGQFTEFLKHAADSGYDAALRKSYQIDGLSDLERRWGQRLSATPMPPS
jgi:hypothetical protein